MCIFFGTKQVVSVDGGYSVTLSITDSPSDGMYQVVKHPAVFVSEEDAQMFLERVKSNLKRIDLNNWIVGNHPCDAWQRKPEDNPKMYVMPKLKY